jgi:hypothetical protein
MKIAECAHEMSGGDFGDARLNQRAASMAELLGQYPNVSIPAALKSRPTSRVPIGFSTTTRSPLFLGNVQTQHRTSPAKLNCGFQQAISIDVVDANSLICSLLQPWG